MTLTSKSREKSLVRVRMSSRRRDISNGRRKKKTCSIKQTTLMLMRLTCGAQWSELLLASLMLDYRLSDTN